MFTVILLTLIGISIFLWIIFTQTNLFGWICFKIVKHSKQYLTRHRPKRLILIRHGESQGNVDSNIYSTTPDHAISLTDKGREQARQCGKELRNLIEQNGSIVCLHSPFRRSKETCNLICEAFSQEQIIEIREDPRVREQEWGNFQDPTRRKMIAAERQIIGRFLYRFKEGESGADVYDRVGLFMNSLYREMDNCLLSNSNILIITHGLFMRLFLMRFYHWTMAEFDKLENFDNCGYCILERDDNDGKFILKTELKTYPEKNTKIEKRLSNNSDNQEIFEEEINATIHIKHIEQNTKKTI